MKAIIVAATAALLAGGVQLARADDIISTTPSCTGVAGTPAAAAVWWGRFAGGREENYSEFTVPIGVTVEGCFQSAAQCRAWLFELKGAYSALPVHAACSEGYQRGPVWPPGAAE